MPQLKKATIKRVYFPSTKDEPNEADRCWIDISSTIKAKDLFTVQDLESEKAKTIHGILAIAKQWNLTDDNNSPLPINEATLSEMGIVDFGTLNKELVAILYASRSELTPDEKKA